MFESDHPLQKMGWSFEVKCITLSHSPKVHKGPF
jgi:hypothetical protein